MDNEEKRTGFLKRIEYNENKLTQEDLMGLRIVQAKRIEEKEKRAELVREGIKLFAPRERKEEAARKAIELKNKKIDKRRRIIKGVGATALAIAIAVGGGLAIADGIKDKNYKEQQIEEMQETGRGMAEAGLSEKTMQALEEYDTLFAQDSEQEISEEDLLNKISGMKDLAVDVMKERMANVTQTDIENITYSARYSKEGDFHGSITVEEGNYGKETTYRIRDLASEGPHLPAECRRILEHFLEGKYEKLSSDLKAGEITKQRAMNKLKKMYPDIKVLAEANLLIDRDGNVVSVDLEQQKDTSKDDGFEVGE